MINIAKLDQNGLDRLAIRQSLPFTLYADLGVAQPKDWLVQNFLGAGEASAFYGKPGDGKSVLVEDMALHVAAGRPWHGRQVKQGLVVYFALERKFLVERRAIAFRDYHDLRDLPFAIVGGIWDFRDPKTAERAVALIRQAEEATEHSVVLVVIDTVSRALCGGDENSSKDIGGLVNSTSVLQATGAHPSWVHHMPHDSPRMRGHGALLGAMDTTVHVANNGGTRTATAVKANDSEEGEKITFTLESVPIATDAAGNPTTAPVVLPAEPGEMAANTNDRKLSNRHRLALEALTESVIAEGKLPPPSFELPSNIRLVGADRWRDEMLSRGVIDRDSKNPRTDFKRIREALKVRQLVGERDGLVWPAVGQHSKASFPTVAV